jgi:hypothetical protein
MNGQPSIDVEKLIAAQCIAKKSEGVDLTNLDVRLRLFLAAAGQAHTVLFHLPLIVTSGRDDAHAAHSKHFEGKAVDLSLHDIGPEELFVWHSVVVFICLRTGCGIFFEFAGLPEEHFHVETNS